MRLAIMQPYFFPYIGYFQLINAVDVFVFYDDVNFIKGGWINRNKILINKKSKCINAQLIGASSNKKIKDIGIQGDFNKVLKSIEQNYKKAPFFNEIFPLISNLLKSTRAENISNLAIESIQMVCDYLGLEKKFKISSVSFSNSLQLEKKARLISICKEEHVITYINAIGGKKLYSKNDFKKEGINLKFLKTGTVVYKQFSFDFVPSLSIIDVLMFNSKGKINKMLNNYELI